MQNIISRAKAILLSPKEEWLVISMEKTTMSEVFRSYVLPLALIPALAGFLGKFIFISYFSMKYFLISLIITYAAQLIAFFVTTYAVDLLAPSFNAEKDIHKSAQLVAYASTGSWVGSILNILPVLGALGSLAGGVYSLYLLYIGIMPMKKVPEDKRIIYVIVTILILMVATALVVGVLSAILLTGLLGFGAAAGFGRGFFR